MPNCKSCGKPFEIKTKGYRSGLCDTCKPLYKEFFLLDPVRVQIAAEYKEKYGWIWTD